MPRLDEIRKSKIARWIVYFFLGLIVLLIIDMLIGSYYQFKSISIEKQIRETSQRREEKRLSDEIYYNRVDSLVNLGQHHNAIKLSELRIKQFPDDKAYITRHIGNIYYHKGDVDSAIIKYSEAINLTSMYITAYVDRGWVYMELDSFYLAINDFEFAARNNWDFYFDLGLAQERNGSLKEAISSYNKYLEHYPNDQECMNKRDSINAVINNDLQQ